MVQPVHRNIGPAEWDIHDNAYLINRWRIQRLPAMVSLSEISQGRNARGRPLPGKKPKRTLSPLSTRALRSWIKTLKVRCAGCGEPDPLVLVFHHVDSAEKFMPISAMAGRRYTKAEICAEAEKCAILCRNCHTRFHAK